MVDSVVLSVDAIVVVSSSVVDEVVVEVVSCVVSSNVVDDSVLLFSETELLL